MNHIQTIAVLCFLGFGNAALADGCADRALTYQGVWLDQSGAPTANYVLAVDVFAEGQEGCYWMEATPKWGIDADVQEVLRVVETELDGGILIAMGRTQSDIDAGRNAWIWVRKDGLTTSGFSEMYFNRRTRGVPRSGG